MRARLLLVVMMGCASAPASQESRPQWASGPPGANGAPGPSGPPGTSGGPTWGSGANELPASSRGRAGSLQLAHYSSASGLIGFVLDRTGGRPRVRIDGEERVYELEVVKRSRVDTDLVSHERHIDINFNNDGSAIWYAAEGLRDALPVWRDGDAAPLPPAR